MLFGDKDLYHPASNSNIVVKNQDIQCTNPASWGKQPNTVSIPQRNWREEFETIVTYINEKGSEIYKQRAILCLIYYYAIHDEFAKGRDLLLLTQLQTTISTINPSTVEEYSLCVCIY